MFYIIAFIYLLIGCIYGALYYPQTKYTITTLGHRTMKIPFRYRMLAIILVVFLWLIWAMIALLEDIHDDW